MKVLIKLAMFTCVMFMLGACARTNEDVVTLEGYVLAVNCRGFLLAEGITSEEYEEIKDIPQNDLIMDGDIHVRLVTVSYGDGTVVEKGDKVSVVVEGDIAESYPEQATAREVKVQ